MRTIQLPCARLVITLSAGNDHARGAAALTQILPRGSEVRRPFSLEDEMSRHGSATLPA